MNLSLLPMIIALLKAAPAIIADAEKIAADLGGPQPSMDKVAVLIEDGKKLLADLEGAL